MSYEQLRKVPPLLEDFLSLCKTPCKSPEGRILSPNRTRGYANGLMLTELSTVVQAIQRRTLFHKVQTMGWRSSQSNSLTLTNRLLGDPGRDGTSGVEESLETCTKKTLELMNIRPLPARR